MVDDSKSSDDDFSSEEEVEDSESQVRRFVGETVKKLFTAGVGAAFMTEESIRKYLGDVKLPRDLLNTLLQGANKSKEELMNSVTDEVVTVIKKIDFVKEASRFVEEHKFRISAEIEVVKKEDSKGNQNDSQNDSQNDDRESEIKTKIRVRA